MSQCKPTRRSRSGCANCKRRKRKCDETQPACLACQKRNIICEGYNVKLRWDCGVATRGHLSGSKVPIRTASSTSTGRPGGLPVAEDLASQPPASEPSPGSASSGSVVHHNDYRSPGYDGLADEDQALLDEFFDSGVHKLYASTKNSWVKPVLRDMSRQSSALVAVCLSLQLRIAGNNEKFHLYFEDALHVFQDELVASVGTIRRGTLCAGLLLCTASILEGLPWTKHLLCMADLYHLRGDLSWLAPHIDLHTYHCLEVLGIMDLPHFVVGRTTPHLGIWRGFRQAQASCKYGKAGGIEVVSGLSRTLLDLFAIADEPGTEERFWLWHGDIGELLQGQLWDAWRFAGMLVSRRQRKKAASAEAIGTVDPSCNDASGAAGIVTLPTTEQLLWRLLSSLDALRLGLDQPEYKHLLVGNAMTYPYLAASLEFGLLRAHPEWKAALDLSRTGLKAGGGGDGLRNLDILLEILDEAWQSGVTSLDIDEAARARGVEIALF